MFNNTIKGHAHAMTIRDDNVYDITIGNDICDLLNLLLCCGFVFCLLSRK